MSLVAETPQLDHEVNVVHPPPCAPITKLPPEILLSIFRILLGISTIFLRPPRLRSVIHVCRFWRNLALNEPSLWTELSNAYEEAMAPRWVDEFIQRSDSLPLTLRINTQASKDLFPQGPCTRRLIQVAPELTHRLGELHIRCCDKDLLARLTKPAPLLTKMNFFHPLGQLNARIPRNFLGDHIPSLQDVTLCHMAIPLGVTWLSGTNLRRLKLDGNSGFYDSDNGASVPISVNFLLQLLTLLPRLEHLSAQFLDKFDDQHSQFPTPSQVHLPYLTFLDVTMPHLRQARFFRYITVESPIALKILVDVREGDFMMIEQICSYFTTNSLPPALINWSPHEISFAVDDAWDGGYDHSHDLSLRGFKNMEELSSFVLPILPSCAIRVLHVQTEHSNWLGLQHLETIEEIHVRFRVEALRQLLRDSRSTCLFPSLRWLRLIGLNWTKADASDLKEWVSRRVVVTSLEGLHFQACRGVPTDDIQLLSRHVKIRWEDDFPLVSFDLPEFDE